MLAAVKRFEYSRNPDHQDFVVIPAIATCLDPSVAQVNFTNSHGRLINAVKKSLSDIMKLDIENERMNESS